MKMLIWKAACHDVIVAANHFQFQAWGLSFRGRWWIVSIKVSRSLGKCKDWDIWSGDTSNQNNHVKYAPTRISHSRKVGCLHTEGTQYKYRRSDAWLKKKVYDRVHRQYFQRSPSTKPISSKARIPGKAAYDPTEQPRQVLATVAPASKMDLIPLFSKVWQPDPLTRSSYV